MIPSARVPVAMQTKFDSISQATDAFCDKTLNDEYKQLIRLVLAVLSRKRPSPLLKGKDSSWAAGAVHAVGMVNFLFDPGQTPHCKSADIHAFFGVSGSNVQAKSQVIRKLLDMGKISPDWCLPSLMDANPLIWMLQVNGVVMDIRHLPLEAQQIALDQGLIPYIPALKEGCL